MSANIIMLIVGLIICFGGIYFRRLCSGIMGFIWGALGALVLIILVVGLYDIDEEEALIGIIVAGIIFAALSAIYYKVCAAINGFSIGFTGLLLILLLSDNLDSWESVIVIALVAGLITAFLSFKYYDYSFIILTALTGAFISSISVFSMTKGEDFGDILFEVMWWGGIDGLSMVWLGTIGLGCVGFFVQLQRLKNLLGAGGSSGGGEAQGNAASAGVVAGNFAGASGSASTFSPSSVNAVASGSDGASTASDHYLSLKSSGDSDKWLLAAPVLSGIVLPILSNLIYRGYYDGPYTLYIVLDWISNIVAAITLGGLVYSTISKEPKFTALYAGLSIVGEVILNISYLQFYGFWGIVLQVLRLPLIWGVLVLINMIIKKASVKPLVLMLCAILLHHYVLNWLPGFYVYFYINAYIAVSMLVTLASVWFFYNKFIGFNVFKISNPNVTA